MKIDKESPPALHFLINFLFRYNRICNVMSLSTVYIVPHAYAKLEINNDRIHDIAQRIIEYIILYIILY